MSEPSGPYRGPYGYPVVREHPQGTLIFVLGILGVVTTVTAPVAWYLGSKARNEIRASGIGYSNESLINAGRILGMIFTILALIAIVFVVIFLAVVTIVAATQS